MSLKLLLFIGLVAVTSIEAKQFLKNFQHKHLATKLATNLPDRAYDHLVRRRRDAEDNKTDDDKISDEEALALTKFFVRVAWEEDKKDVLGGFLDSITDTSNNLTLIGWQRVLDEQGKVQEIRTVQLVIPPKPQDPDAPTNIVESEDDDDDDDEESERLLPHHTINELKEIFEPFNAIGIPASITFEEYDEEGENPEIIYLDKDELYVQGEGFSIYNKTAIASNQEVSDFITSLKPAALGKPSVLKYDVDGNLLSDQSHIRPQLLGSVIDYYEASDELLTEAPQVIAQIAYQHHKEDIPKELALHYNKAHPEYKWKVLVDPDNRYIVRDVELTLTYDNFDFDESSDISYLVYGSKKATK